jgi:hypothetical protein
MLAAFSLTLNNSLFISKLNSTQSYNETIAVIILVSDAISRASDSPLDQSILPLDPSIMQYVLQVIIGNAYRSGIYESS